jgi:hypothetical protein
MAKLRANINYNRRNQQESVNHTESLQKNTTLNQDKNKEMDQNKNENIMDVEHLHNEELNEELNDDNSFDNQDNVDLNENLVSQFNDNLNEWLENL